MQIDVMFGILITLLNKGRVSSVELSLKYEVSRRTVLRYMDKLGAAQVPIMSHRGKNGGFSVAENFSLSKMFFSKQEFSRLQESVKSMKSLLNDNVSSSISDKIACLTSGDTGHILASDTIFIDSGPWGDVVSYKNKMSALEGAIRGNLSAEIVYHDANSRISKRIIQPYTLVFKQGIWYVYAFCTLREDFRLFKLGRIASIAYTGDNFIKQPLDIATLPYNINWFNNENNINLVLEVSPKIRSEIEEWLSFENVIKHKNGRIYAFARVPEHGLVSKLLSFGASIKVIQPQQLREQLLKTVSGIKNLYK